MTTKTSYYTKIKTLSEEVYYSRTLSESEAEEVVEIYRDILAKVGSNVGGVLQTEDGNGVVTIIPARNVDSVTVYPQQREVFQ